MSHSIHKSAKSVGAIINSLSLKVIEYLLHDKNKYERIPSYGIRQQNLA